MNYEAHLSTVFATPELAEEFMKAVMRQLNDVTFNGANKIDKVLGDFGPLSIGTPKYKTLDRTSYYLNLKKCERVGFG